VLIYPIWIELAIGFFSWILIGFIYIGHGFESIPTSTVEMDLDIKKSKLSECVFAKNTNMDICI
jgi:hypothetical protein